MKYAFILDSRSEFFIWTLCRKPSILISSVYRLLTINTSSSVTSKRYQV